MVELELVSNEVQLMRSCLRFRMMELAADDRKASYTCLIDELYGVGFFRFSLFQAACLVLSLVDFASVAQQLGHYELAEEAVELAAWVHMQAYSRPLGEIPKESPERYMSREMAVLVYVS